MRRLPALLGFALLAPLVAAALLPAHATESREEGGSLARDARAHEARGVSVLHVAGLCDPALECEEDPGAFFLEAAGMAGTLVLEWQPLNQSLRELRVRVGGYEATGPSPLVLDAPNLEPGRHEVHILPAARIAGAYDQRVAWRVVFDVATPLPWVQEAGTSRYDVAAACLLDTCDPATRITPGTFVLPWATQGARLEVRWDPLDGSQRVRIAGTAYEAAGDPPLLLEGLALAPGEYAVELLPDTWGRALLSQEATWSFAAERSA